jgi:hypothetical protein
VALGSKLTKGSIGEETALLVSMGMTEPQGLTVFIHKHAELAGKLEAPDRETRAVRVAMAHLDDSIQLIRRGYDVRSIRPSHPHDGPC